MGSELRRTVLFLAAAYAVLAGVSLGAMLAGGGATTNPATGIPAPLVGDLRDGDEDLPAGPGAGGAPVAGPAEPQPAQPRPDGQGTETGGRDAR